MVGIFFTLSPIPLSPKGEGACFISLMKWRTAISTLYPFQRHRKREARRPQAIVTTNQNLLPLIQTINMKGLPVLITVLLSLQLSAKEKTLLHEYKAVADTIAPNPDDVKSVDAVIAALYDVISGPAGQTRNWNRMRSLFLPEGKLVATGQRPGGEIVKRVLTVDDYINVSGPVLEKNGFFEKEINRKSEVYGHIAHCFSSYESRKAISDAQPFMRGINSIQLFNDGKRWWILSVFWQPETKELPLPKEYLKE
jgi:hypothetical protein